MQSSPFFTWELRIKTDLTLFRGTRFSDNWTVRPLPGDQCILRAQNLCEPSIEGRGYDPPAGPICSYFLVCLSVWLAAADCPKDAFLALNIATDVAILTVPLPLLWRLRLSIWKRLVLILLLCGGLFVIIMAIVRTVLNFVTQSNVLVKLKFYFPPPPSSLPQRGDMEAQYLRRPRSAN